MEQTFWDFLKNKKLSTEDEIKLFKIYKCLLSSKNLDELAKKYFKYVKDASYYENPKVLKNVLDACNAGICAFYDLNRNRKATLINSKANSEYYKLLKKTLNLASELKLSSSIELSILYSYLLWNGYFSINHKNVCTLKNGINVPGSYCFDVANGVGVCLNYTEMLTDLLNKSGKKSATLLNCISQNVSINNKLPIKRNVKVSTNSQSLSPKVANIPNHAFTLTHYNDKTCIFDPTNLAMAKVINRRKAIFLGGDGIVSLDPITSYVFSKDKKSEDTLDEFNNISRFNNI